LRPPCRLQDSLLWCASEIAAQSFSQIELNFAPFQINLPKDQRYETGFGAMFGADMIRTKKWADTDRKLAALTNAHPQVRAKLDALSNAETLEISVYPYFKLPLEGPRHATVDGKDVLDYRMDLSTAINWKLATTITRLCRWS